MRSGHHLFFALAAAALALACSKPAVEGAAGGPEPFYKPEAPFVVPPPRAPCGDAAIMARFAACKAAAGRHEQAACEAAGGTWGRIGLHEGCNCPTGQGDCRCARAGDCLSRCVLDPGSGRCPESAAQGNWRCAPYHDVVGCFCYLGEGGAPESICAD
jgi:hypothetical protein